MVTPLVAIKNVRQSGFASLAERILNNAGYFHEKQAGVEPNKKLKRL